MFFFNLGIIKVKEKQKLLMMHQKITSLADKSWVVGEIGKG